jgi:hypothetical protein
LLNIFIAEYELLAEEAATAGNEIDAAAEARRAAAEAWEKARAELEVRLAFALKVSRILFGDSPSWNIDRDFAESEPYM